MASILNPPLDLAAPGALGGRQFFEKLVGQSNRLLTIQTPLAESALVVEKFHAREALSAHFAFEVDCLSTAAHFELKTLLGEEVSVRLRLADGTSRPFHGIVVAASNLGADGGLARYRLSLRPWLWLLSQRRDCFIFQDKTVIEIAQEIFADYSIAHYRIEVSAPLRKRSLCVQYRESDFDFLARLLSEEGLSFYFEHLDPDPASAAHHAKHCLVIRDAQAKAPVCRQAQVRFQRAAAVEAADTIQTLAAERRIQPNRIVAASWDYKKVFAPAASADSSADSGDLPVLEHYDGSEAYEFEHSEHAKRIAALKLAAFELDNKTYCGSGAVRSFSAGQSFSLSGHPDFAPDEYITPRAKADNQLCLLWVEHEAANNLEPGMKALLGTTQVERGSYRNRFACVAAHVQIVPHPLPRPRIGPQTALVVGIADEPITTERDHRVKLQFPWQRGQTPNPGGLTETSSADADGNAPGNEQSGTWVRVAETLAGANYGSNFVPRIGHEVVVDFGSGLIDRPVIVAQLHNGEDLPPYSAGLDSSANHPGTVSGVHTRGLDGRDANQWLIDDARGQLRASLKSTYAASQFNQGYLIQQTEHDAFRGAWRGLGFELRSDAWGVVRAEEGLALTTRTRAQAVSTQLDIKEALSDLRAALDLSRTLSNSAQHHTAQPLRTLKDLESLIEDSGSHYAEPVNGQPATTPDGQPVERFAAPLMLLDAAANMALATPAATLLHSADSSHFTTGHDTQITAAQTFAAVSGKASSLYTHAGGIKTIAANGPVSFQAHDGKLKVFADQSMRVLSINASIEIQANQRITLYAGGSSITLDGANITFACPGTFSVKGSNHAFVEPASAPAKLPSLPTGKIDIDPADLLVEHVYHDLEGLQAASFEAIFADGSKRSGATNRAGVAELKSVPPGAVKICFAPDARPYERINSVQNAALGQSIDVVLAKYAPKQSGNGA